MIRREYVKRVGRAKSVKHVEYEILRILKHDGWRPVDHIHLRRLFEKLVPGGSKGDKVAFKRWDTACKNLGVIFENLLASRVKHLPEDHVDYEGAQ